jgi:hypothetical protein
MAINFGNNVTLSQTGGRISAPGRVLQVVQTNNTVGMITSSTAAVDFFYSAPITLSSAGNRVIIEWHSDNRVNDWYDGSWNLYYMQIVYVNTGAVLSYTGYRGETTYNIRHYHKNVTHIPGNVGPHTYKLQGWSYSALPTTFGVPGFGSTSGSDGISYIRMTEVAV